MHSRRVVYIEYGIWITVTLGITVASLISSAAAGAIMLTNDKTAHLAAYAVLGFVSYPVIRRFPLPGSGTDGMRQLGAGIWTLLYCSALGGGLELLQTIAGRASEWLDFGADTAGAVVGVILSWIVLRLLELLFHREPDGRSSSGRTDNLS